MELMASLVARASLMQAAPGCLGVMLQQDGPNGYRVSSMWQSIPDFEAWALSASSRRSQLPDGVFQMVPKKGEGFPEDHLPFKDLTDPVIAKY